MSILKNILFIIILLNSTNGIGQSNLSIRVVQLNYIGNDHEVYLSNDRLKVKKTSWDKSKERSKTIYNRKIKNSQSINKIMKLVTSKRFEGLKET